MKTLLLGAAASGISPVEVGSLLVALISVVVAAAAFLSSRTKDERSELDSVISAAVSEAISPVNARLNVLETKIDVFWKNVAYDAAQILHSKERNGTS